MIKVTGISGVKGINVGNFKIPTRIKITEETPKRKEYVCLTHNDLDAAGCVAVLERTLKPVKYFYTNYADLHDKLYQLEQYCRENNIPNVIIADVSLSQCRDSLISLQRTLKEISSTSDFRLFDHHLYDPNFFNGVTAEVNVDKSKCASKILFDYFNDGSLNDMRDFIKYVNIHDIYLKNEPDFETALTLNEAFFGFTKNVPNKILEYVKEAQYLHYNVDTLLGDLKFTLKNDFETLQSELKRAKKYFRSKKGVKITVVLSWDLFPFFTFYEMKAGQDVVIGVKYGIFKIRVKEGVFTEEQLTEIRKTLCGDANYGHSLAFTYKANVPTKNDVIGELTKISETFNKYC